MIGYSRYRLPIVLIALLCPRAALHADGGTVCQAQRRGAYQITVFAAPTPLRAGPVDVSVLIQDAATGEPVPEAHILVRAMPRGRPDEEIRQPASTTAATNKLFQAAILELPCSGWWDITLDIETPGEPMEIHFALEVNEPLPKERELAPWIAWPALVVLLFGLHQGLVRRKSRIRVAAADRPRP
jgi:hypothetical protein